MRTWAALLVAAGLAGQEPPAPVRGTLLEWDQAAGGQFTLRARDNYVYCFAFDSRTEVERDAQRITVQELRKGDIIEVLSDNGPRPRHARQVRVVLSKPAPPPPRPPAQRHFLYRGHYNLTDELYPRGNLTFSGIVSHVNDDCIILRTRSAGTTSILLRSDTRYMRQGQQVARAFLGVNTHVFIRGARNLDGEVEAYSVMWGGILKPN